MSRINKKLSDIYIVLSFLLNYAKSSSVITTAHYSVGGTQSIIKIEGGSYNIKKIGNNDPISLEQKSKSLSNGEIYDYFTFYAEPGSTYEIEITVNKQSVSLEYFLFFFESNHADSIIIKNYGDITITDLSYAFYYCSDLTSIDLSMLDISGVTSFLHIFYYCKKLVSVNFGSSLLQKLKDMSYMFEFCDCLRTINLSNFDTSNVSDMSGMFAGCHNLTSINLSNFNTSNVRDMNHMFGGCNKLISINLSNFDTSNVRDMNHMFDGCNKLISINLSNFDTSKVTNFEYMFYICNSLTSLDLSNFNTSKAKNMNSMFSGCNSLTYINLENFDISSVNDMSEMFYGCNSLTSIHINKFITKNLTNIDSMFYNCNHLKSLNLSNFNTSLVTSMNSMFYGCMSLVYLNINNFDTSSVTNMNYIFSNCLSLTSLNLSSFNIKEGTDTDLMFSQTSENLIYCINNNSYNKIKSQLMEKKCATRDYNCLDEWREKPEKIIAETGECINDCNSTINYIYEYNGKCYSSCPKGTTTLFNKNNDLVCQSFDVDEILKMIEKEKETETEIETQEIITEKVKETETQEIITEKAEKVKEVIDNNILLYKYCAPNDFFKKECEPPKQYDYMIKLIKNDISEGKMDSLIENVLNNNQDIIETYDNTIYQITSTFNQKNIEYKNISTMEFNSCEEALKDIYNISKNDSLIIFKYDYSITELLIPIIGYELYHPITKQVLDLNYCKKNKTKINILIPVQINEKEVYKHNPNDAYYKDRCNTDFNNKNIDITIYDKKNIYNEKNLALCAKNCEFDGYNNST